MSRSRSAGLLLAALLAASGCFTARYTEGNAVAEERLARIQPGVTTKEEILEWFGPPQAFNDTSMLERLIEGGDLRTHEMLYLPFSDVLAFELTRGRLRAFMLLIFNWVEVRFATDSLMVFFDEEERVLYYAYRKGTDALD